MGCTGARPTSVTYHKNLSQQEKPRPFSTSDRTPNSIPVLPHPLRIRSIPPKLSKIHPPGGVKHHPLLLQQPPLPRIRSAVTAGARADAALAVNHPLPRDFFSSRRGRHGVADNARRAAGHGRNLAVSGDARPGNTPHQTVNARMGMIGHGMDYTRRHARLPLPAGHA